MNGEIKSTALKDEMINLFQSNQSLLMKNTFPGLSVLRRGAIEKFRETGFPDNKMEAWKNTDLSEALARPYDHHLQPITPEENIQHIFRCHIPNLNTTTLAQYNGWFVTSGLPLLKSPEGIITGSLSAAMEQYQGLFGQYFGKIADPNAGGFDSLNAAFAQDGIFIFIPDNTIVTKPFQIVNAIRHKKNIFIQSRNLIILGKNSSITLVHCEDSFNEQPSFTNVTSEIVIGENASLDHYKLQNLNNDSSLVNSTWFRLSAGSRLSANSVMLNGGLIRNNTCVKLEGRGAHAEVFGLYLMDKHQHIDNHIFVDHASPDCTSSELFKGILDEHASGVFNGHVLVRRDSQRTNAYQSNKNILLTDTARINTKPFLEIYADDVKCSHGATVGQLDAESMFYLRSRGIGEDSARMLLLYAFADEIISHISIPALRVRIEDMVKKRLRGELSVCDQCVLHCSHPDKPVEFEIDLSKI